MLNKLWGIPNHKHQKFITGILIFVIVIFALAAAALAAAAPAPAGAQEVHFLPPQSSASYCNTTEVEIWVNATSFQSGQIELTYNPSCAHVIDWVGNTTNFPMGGWTHEDGKDRIYFVGSALKTGEYMIGTLTIHCVNESREGCVTTLDFTEQSKLFDDHGSTVPANWIDGTFECKAEVAPPGEFDTEAPPNPYPSIFGTLNGTLTPSHDIIADKMFTYPCAGTGGHTEYVKIWNDTWQEGIEAHWHGYQVADYHIIIFPQQFTLFANQKYNYTIRTGSYPQIWHTDRLETGTGDGVIECSEFVDANGRSHSNWIPAFRLFS